MLDAGDGVHVPLDVFVAARDNLAVRPEEAERSCKAVVKGTGIGNGSKCA